MFEFKAIIYGLKNHQECLLAKFIKELILDYAKLILRSKTSKSNS